MKANISPANSKNESSKKPVAVQRRGHASANKHKHMASSGQLTLMPLLMGFCMLNLRQQKLTI